MIFELRAVWEEDLPLFYAFQTDLEANRMVGFIPKTREAFMAHWAKIMGDESIIKRAILLDGLVAGHIVCFTRDGRREIGYWLGREFWGKGLASLALVRFLLEVPERPLYAGVSKRNPASLRVLEKSGFKIIAEDEHANAAGEKVPGFVLELR